MPDILAEICETKRAHVTQRRKTCSLGELESTARFLTKPTSFSDALSHAAADGTALIAEIKKASPSAGLIRPDFDPAHLARAYRDGGAACVSVLTDEPYFQGHDSFIRVAHSASGLPCLRKDFLVDPYQIVEARALGAAAVLVIMAAVDDTLAAELTETAHAFDLETVVEVHDGHELDRALRIGGDLIGINNRNLKTLKVDLSTTLSLAPRVPEGLDVICESGIRTHNDILRFEAHGIRRFLVGEHLMRQKDVTAATRLLLGSTDTVQTD